MKVWEDYPTGPEPKNISSKIEGWFIERVGAGMIRLTIDTKDIWEEYHQASEDIYYFGTEIIQFEKKDNSLFEELIGESGWQRYVSQYNEELCFLFVPDKLFQVEEQMF